MDGGAQEQRYGAKKQPRYRAWLGGRCCPTYRFTDISRKASCCFFGARTERNTIRCCSDQATPTRHERSVCLTSSEPSTQRDWTGPLHGNGSRERGYNRGSRVQFFPLICMKVAGEMFKVPRDIFSNSSLSTPLANIPMDSPAGMVVDDVSKEHFSAFCRVRFAKCVLFTRLVTVLTASPAVCTTSACPCWTSRVGPRCLRSL
jgi:hypothetical protein